MGVRSLQTYVERNCPSAFLNINLVEMATEYRKTHPNIEPIIVVDGINCIHYWIKELDWICGGDWLNYQKIIEEFIASFHEIGIKLVFFFDGLQVADQKEAIIRRRSNALDDIKHIFTLIKQKSPLTDMFVAPACLSLFIRLALRHVCGATVYSHVSGECDHTIASFAVKHDCMAILAQDSDYIIFDTVPYISMKNLDIKTMATRMYCRQALSNELRIQLASLPLFACMLGTELVPRDCLDHLHSWLCQKFYTGYGRPNIITIIQCIGKYIRSLNIHTKDQLVSKGLDIHKQLCSTITLEDFKRGLVAYTLDFTSIHVYRYPGKQSLPIYGGPEESVYDTLLRMTANVEMNTIVLDVIAYGKVNRSPSLEDESALEKITPIVLVYRPIRQRLYGLIFNVRDNYFDKSTKLLHSGTVISDSDTVKESWFSSSNRNGITDIVSPLPLDLSADLSSATIFKEFLMDDYEGLLEKKWKVFRACVGLTISVKSLQEIPHEFKSLCIILNYLIQHPGVPLKFWEFQAFLVQAIHPNASDASWHTQQQIEPYDARAVHLATLLLRGISGILDVITFCGNPYPVKYAIPWNYFDGKRFHYYYKEMAKGVQAAQLLGKKNSAIDILNYLEAITMEGIDQCKCFS